MLDGISVAKAFTILDVNVTNIDAETTIIGKVEEYEKPSTMKNWNFTSSMLDLTIELRTDNGAWFTI